MRSGGLGAVAAGAIYEDVDFSQFGINFFFGLEKLIFYQDVTFKGQGAAVNLTSGFLCTVMMEVDNGQFRLPVGEEFSQGATQSASAPGDNNHFIIYVE